MTDKLKLFTSPSAFPNPQRLRIFMHEKGIADHFDETIYDMSPVGEQRGWNGNSERFGGRKIEYEIEFRRLLDRQIGRLRPAQNLVDILGGAPEQVREVWAVGHETPGLDIFAQIENRR